MFTVQIARLSPSGRFQERTCTDTEEECKAFIVEAGDTWTVVSFAALTPAEIEAREIRAEWRGWLGVAGGAA